MTVGMTIGMTVVYDSEFSIYTMFQVNSVYIYIYYVSGEFRMYICVYMCVLSKCKYLLEIMHIIITNQLQFFKCKLYEILQRLLLQC